MFVGCTGIGRPNIQVWLSVRLLVRFKVVCSLNPFIQFLDILYSEPGCKTALPRLECSQASWKYRSPVAHFDASSNDRLQHTSLMKGSNSVLDETGNPYAYLLINRPVYL